MKDDKKEALAAVLMSFAENCLAALRTAGALLIGNSALVYFKVIGPAVSYVSVLLMGVLLVVVASIPIGHSIKLISRSKK